MHKRGAVFVTGAAALVDVAWWLVGDSWPPVQLHQILVAVVVICWVRCVVEHAVTTSAVAGWIAGRRRGGDDGQPRLRRLK